MARRKLDGSLRGMILVKVEQAELDGKKFNLMTVSYIENVVKASYNYCLFDHTDGALHSASAIQKWAIHTGSIVVLLPEG